MNLSLCANMLGFCSDSHINDTHIFMYNSYIVKLFQIKCDISKSFYTNLLLYVTKGLINKKA